ncbi:helix-turn-helix domain-containing protein, partial [Streptococcus pneumoniae]|nr:helix-turn-helix domain-containing protein [Streptococcus pneumoniae]
MQEKLLILRKKQGISQQELADYLKISVTSY